MTLWPGKPCASVCLADWQMKGQAAGGLGLCMCVCVGVSMSACVYDCSSFQQDVYFWIKRCAFVCVRARIHVRLTFFHMFTKSRYKSVNRCQPASCRQKHACVCVCSVLRACLSLNSSGVHGEDRPYGAVPGEPINYRAVTLGRLRFVIDASCAAGEELSHAAKGKGHAADRPGGRWQEGPGGGHWTISSFTHPRLLWHNIVLCVTSVFDMIIALIITSF